MMLDAPPATGCPTYYSLPPRDRRAILILACTLIISPAFVVAIWTLLLGAPPNDLRGFVLFAGLCAAFLLSLRRPRIRVDANGIARRGIVGWRVIPWSEIDARPAQTLCVGQGPWTGASRRILRLYRAWWLKPEDFLSLQRLLTPPGTCTHLPEVPRRFQITVFGPGTLELDQEGLRLDGHSGVQTRSWSEVRKVTIRKERATTPAMDGIRIELTDGKEFSTKTPTIECDSPCECRHDYLLQLFLRSVLHPDQLLIWAKRGAPASIAEAKFRCDLIQSELRMGRIFGRGYALLVAGLLCFGMATANDLSMQLAIQLIVFGVLLGPLFWKLHRQQRSDLEDLQSYLDSRHNTICMR